MSTFVQLVILITPVVVVVALAIGLVVNAVSNIVRLEKERRKILPWKN